MEITTTHVLSFLYILVAVMLILVLYHVMFIVVDLRKIMRRFDNLTEQVESVLLKPLSMTDNLFQWLIDHLEGKKKDKDKKHPIDHHSPHH